MLDPRIFSHILSSGGKPKNTEDAKMFFKHNLPPPLARVMCDVVERQSHRPMMLKDLLDASGRILEALDEMQRQGMMTEKQRNEAVMGIIDSMPSGTIRYDGVALFEGVNY